MKAVVITGASSGIGKDAALYLDKLGFHVFAGVRKEQDAQELQEHATDRLTPIFIDVNDQSTIDKSAQQVTDAVGDYGLVGLINNAGIAIVAPFEFVPYDDLRKQIDTNFVGQVMVTQAFLPLLRIGKGRILNMSSLSGTLAFPLFGAYAASKWALEAFTDALRQEVYPWGIDVISIQPGSVDTPIWSKEQQAAQDRLDKFPDEAHQLYRKAFERMQRVTASTSQQGIPVERISEIIHTALTVTRPKTRYFINQRKWQMKILRWLPDRIRDRIIRKNLNMPEISDEI